MTTNRLLQLVTNISMVFLVAFTMVGVQSAQAQDTWYVNSTEGDDLNDGSQMDNAGAGVGPFATFDKATDEAADGDTVIILAGTYGEDLDTDSIELTVQVQASGPNTIADFGGLYVYDDASFTGGDGEFQVDYVEIGYSTATFDSGIMIVEDGSDVYMYSDDTGVAAVGGNSMAYDGDFFLYYSVDASGADDDIDITSGLEIPAGGDFGEGELDTDDDTWDNGSLTIDQDISLDYIEKSNDHALTFEGTVTLSTGDDDDISLDGDATVTFEDDVDVDDEFDISGDIVLVVQGAATADNFQATDGSEATFESTLDAGGIDIEDGAIADFQGAVSVSNDDFDVSTTESVTTSDVDLNDNDLNQTGGGSFTMASTLTIGDDNAEVDSDRVNNTSGTMTIDNIVIEGVDDVGEDGSAADADEYVQIIIDNDDVFVLNGTVTEATIVDDDDADEDVDYVLGIDNADDALFTFNASTSFSGDVTNSTDDFDNDGAGGDDEGIAVGASVEIIAAFPDDFDDLGFWGGGTLEISEGAAAIDDLEEVGTFVLSAARDIDSGLTSTGNVDLEADGTDVSVLVDFGGVLTVAGDGITFTGDGTSEVDGLSVTGTGFVLGDGDDALDSDGDTDLGDGTVDGDMNVDDGDFSTDGGDVTGAFDVDGGNASFDGGSNVGGTVNVEGDVTIEDGAAVTWGTDGVDGLDIDASDVEGALTVDGTLTLTDEDAGEHDDNPNSGGAGTNLSVGSVAIAAPDGELDVDGVDLILSGSFSGGTLTGGDDLKINIPSGGASFTPGPNTDLDFFSIEGSGRTLTVGEGFEIDTDGLFVQNDATLALGDNTITISGGDVTLEDEATVTTSEPTGALAFASGGAQSILVTGAPTTNPTLSNIRVNGGSDVLVEDDIDISGDLSLNVGSFEVDGGVTVEMTGPNATITRQPEFGALTVTGDLDGEWNVVYFGDADDEDSTGEISDGQTRNVTVNLNDGEAFNFIDDADITGWFTMLDGDVDIDADIGVAGDLTVGGNTDGFEVSGGNTLDVDGDAAFSADVTGAGELELAGDVTVDDGVGIATALSTFDGTGTVTLNGAMTGSSLFEGDYTVNSGTDTDDGDSELGTTTVDNGATVVINVQTINGPLFVTDGDLTLNMIDDDDATDGDDAAIPGPAITVDEDGHLSLGGDIEVAIAGSLLINSGDAESGSVVLTQAVDIAGGVEVGQGDDVAATFDNGGNGVAIGGDFDVDAGSSVSGSGVWDMDDGGDLNLNGNSVENLTASDMGTVESDATVTGTLDVDDDFDIDATFTMFLSGDAEFYAGADISGDGEFQTTGTTITLEGDADVENFNVNSASTTTLADDASIGAPYSLDVYGDFTMSAGTLAIGEQELEVSGGDFDYDVATGDAITMGGGQVFFSAATAWDSDDVNVTLANIASDSDVDSSNDGGDGLTVTGTADLMDGAYFTTDDADALTDNSTVSFADGSTMMIGEDDGGAVDIFEEDPTLGAEMNYVYYGGPGGGFLDSGNELATSIATLDLDADTGLDIDDDVSIDVSTSITVDGTLDIDPDDGDDQTMTLADGGTVIYEDDADLDESITFAGSMNMIIRGLAASSDSEWPNGLEPASFSLEDDGPFAPHEDRSAGNVTIDDDLDLTAPGTVFTVTGSLTVQDDGSFSTTADDFLSMGGAAAQTMTFTGDAPEDLEIDNAAGVNLVGSDLDFATVAGTLYLTDGPLNTGDNNVILDHGGTGAQGYMRTNGVINGNVQKYIETSGASPNRIEFPTGTAAGEYRPFAVTFNDPVGDIGDIDTWDATLADADMLLTASYSGASAMGTNGLPVATTDSEGNPLSIGRYPEFHWNVNSSPTVSPSVDYDVEFQAEGYANFANEDVERMRAIRRQDGATTNFWILTSPTAGDNDNYAVTATEPVAVARNAVGAISNNGVLFTFGLEQNMVATDPAAFTVNADDTSDLDLTTVFSGGDENYTYAITGGDGFATAAAAGDVMTTTGVAAGATSFTVTATDGFGDTATATVTVTVSEAFVAGDALADVAVNVAADAGTVDASGATTGGTSPNVYTVATSDATVAAAAIDAATGEVTLTYGVVGTATITVTVTDGTGAAVDSAFDVTVNTALGAGGALAGVTVEEGATSDVDVSGEFTGGTGAYTYAAASDSDDNATASADGATVTVTGVSAYTVVSGAVTGDAPASTVTVTATDEFGAEITSAFTVDVNPVAGNVDGSGGPSPAGASAVLDHFLGLSTLTAKQQVAADFNGDTSITPFDAALIFDAFFNGKDEVVANPVADMAFGEIVRENNIISIPVTISGDINDVVSASFTTQIDPALATIIGVTSELGEGWIIKHVVDEDGTISLALAGNGNMSVDGSVATINIELTGGDVQFNLGGEGAINDNTTASIDDVEVAELPETFALHGNYPNPFNPTTAINFDLPESADVEIHVIDMIGRQVMTLPATTLAAGANRTVQIDASRLASGPYFYRVIAKMESKTLVETGRMMLVK